MGVIKVYGKTISSLILKNFNTEVRIVFIRLSNFCIVTLKLINIHKSNNDKFIFLESRLLQCYMSNISRIQIIALFYV